MTRVGRALSGDSDLVCVWPAAYGGLRGLAAGATEPSVSREQGYSNEQGPGSLGPAPAQGNRRVNKKIRSVTALAHQDTEMQNTRYF